ncbi:MAG TPA: translocation/assembly module TamB domain-containing protein [Panacibacter sp.]|nr:translocation/assembly module TamB domain-containing protein [Panacibacter sp.]HNP46475.1 translocation/assembly module TamB domain-containing protein [Panacibacter sp.]
MKKIARKFLKILAWILGCIILLLLLVYILIQIPAVQDYAREKIVVYLENKIKTKVEIEKLSIAFPKRIVLENVFFEDQQKDTLLYGKELRVDIALFKLLSNEVNVQYLSLNGISLNVHRLNTDTVFNYDYIVKAFATEPPSQPSPQDSSARMKFNIGKVVLKNINAVYRDDAAGNAASLKLGNFETEVKRFDPDQQIFDIKDIVIQDLVSEVHLYPATGRLPIVNVAQPATTGVVNPAIKIGSVLLKQVRVNYTDDVGSMFAAVNIGELNTHPSQIDLQNTHVALKDFVLNNCQSKITLGKSVRAGADSVSPGKEAPASPWQFEIANLKLRNNQLAYDDNNIAVAKSGIDYSHLFIDSFNLVANGLVLKPSTYKGNINDLSFREQRGAHLKKFQATFLYTDTAAYLENILLQTDETLLKNNILVRYTSLASLTKQPGDVYVEANLDHCSIAIKDVLIFAPMLAPNLKGYEQAVLRLNSSIKGQLKNLSIPAFELSGLGSTYVNLAGTIRGLPDAARAVYHINITSLAGTKKDIYRFIPSRVLPARTRLPETFSVTGFFNGSMKDFNTQLHLKTSSGNIDAIASLNAQEAYRLKANLKNFNAGYVLGQDSLFGKVSMHIDANGNGLDVRHGDGDFNVQVLSAVIKNYNYQDLTLAGNLDEGLLKLDGGMNDNNIRFDLDASANLRNKYPALQVKMQLDTINLHALNLVADTVAFHARIDATIPVADPDSLNGKIFVNDIRFTAAGRSMHADSIVVISSADALADSLHLYVAGALRADLTGKYQLTKLVPSIEKTISQYYHLASADTVGDIAEQHFQFHAVAEPNSTLLQFVPALNGSDTIVLDGQYNSSTARLDASLRSRKVVYNDLQADSINIFANSASRGFLFGLELQNARSNSFNLHQTALRGILANNQANFFLDIKDSKKQSQYSFGGLLRQVPAGVRFTMRPDSLILNYEPWSMTADNYIQYDSSGLLVYHFKLSSNEQSLSINSTPNEVNAPVRADFKDFKIGTITKIANQTALNLDGNINGNFVVKNIATAPVFTSDLQVNNITYNKDSLGDLAVKVNNEQANAFAAHVSLQGNNNDVKLDGMYYTGEGRIDLKLAMQQLNLAMVKPFAAGQVDSIKGFLKGDISIAGTTAKPSVNGELTFADASVVPTISGEAFKLSNEKIIVNGSGIHFDNFTLLDSASNKAVINGDVLTEDFKNYRFALTLDAEDFVLVNAPQGTNKPFYGKLNVTSNIKMEGSMESPKVNADIHVNKETNFTLVLPSENPEVQDRKGVVVFEDKDQPADSLTVKSFIDTLSNRVELKGIDVAATIETDTAAAFTLVIDERNGDALTVKGQADLTGGIDKSGKVSLTGNYELRQGSYQVSLTVLKRKFEIQQGSVITWTGDPKQANIDISAVYLAKAAPIDLVQSQLAGRSTTEINTFKQKLPFQVVLHMKGELLKPIITFDINLPEDELSRWPDVDSKLQQVRADESELNKQVFALLLLNRFVAENPFVSASGGGGAEDIARQSASRILTDQLNQLAGSLIKGVDLTFDLNSEQDYASGTDAYRTDFTVGVSKRLLNDRLSVYVGSNFELEGPSNTNRSASTIAGDVAVDYKVSKDGRYKLRAYRKNEYEGVIEGEVVETGLSFIFTLDYNEFKELFEGKKVKKKKLAEKKATIKK